MKKNKWIAALVILILAVTVITIFYVRNSKEDTQGIKIIYGTKEVTVTMDELDKTEFEGEMVNGKGEVSDNSYNGILLSELLTQKGFDLSDIKNIVVTAADGYNATVTKEELQEPDRVYLAVKMNGELIEGLDKGDYRPQLIVFKDKNSRRGVRSVSEITLNDK
jgi:hypothetical protein